MRGKRGMQNSRGGDERETGKKVAGEAGGRAAASAQPEQAAAPTRTTGARGGAAGKSTRRPRKSDI